MELERRSPEGDAIALVRRYRALATLAGRARARGDHGAAALERELLELRAQLTGLGWRRSLIRGSWEAFRDFPCHVYALRWHVALAAGFFFVAAGFGWWATVNDPSAAAWLLPDAVHDGIIARLADGRHWLEEVDMVGAPALSGSLLVHNLEAAMQALALGILAGVGAAAAMIENGAFLGAVAGLVHTRGLDRVLWAFIAPHGVLEFPVVCLAGGAGLALGQAVVLPGPRGRGAALRAAASHAGPIAVALVPLLLLAAVVEGFVSPQPKPDWASMLIAVSLGAALLGYLATGWRREPASITSAPVRRQREIASRR
jgi:uncharacterized membrane protein SpoIIM required for sporulation